MEEEEEEKRMEEGPVSQVDPFLVEALENPRHRLAVLRLELDIQQFMENSDQHQFEFQHFPTSYLRCAAHRVAQHYGLQTSTLDNIGDGKGNRIAAIKTPDSKYPAVCLSDIPTKHQPENEKNEQFKIAIRPRKSNEASEADRMDLGTKGSALRTVEEREEEYDKARARIFSRSCSPEVDCFSSLTRADDKRHLSSTREGQECHTTVTEENGNIISKFGTSRVAIFRDREKDLSDPDYDRSFNRYFRVSIPPFHSFSLGACNFLHPSVVQYQAGLSHLGQLPRTFQAPVRYMPPNAVYMQWPDMMYAYNYDHLRHAVSQVPVNQQPLSFE